MSTENEDKTSYVIRENKCAFRKIESNLLKIIVKEHLSSLRELVNRKNGI